MNNEQKRIVIHLFMEVSDKKALEKIYEFTKDNLVKILLKWNKQYKQNLKEDNSKIKRMYEDLISYIFEKYNLKEV